MTKDCKTCKHEKKSVPEVPCFNCMVEFPNWQPKEPEPDWEKKYHDLALDFEVHKSWYSMKEIDELRKAKESAEEELSNLEAEVARLQTMLGPADVDWKQKYHDLHLVNALHEDEIRVLEAEVKRLKKQWEAGLLEHSGVIAENKRLEETNDELRKSFEKTLSHQKTVYEAEVKRLKVEMETMESVRIRYMNAFFDEAKKVRNLTDTIKTMSAAPCPPCKNYKPTVCMTGF